MGACLVCGADDGPQVVGILDAVQQEYKGRLPFFSGLFQDILHRSVAVGCGKGDDALMLSGLRQLVEPFLIHKADLGLRVLFPFPQDALEGVVVGSLLNKQPVDGPACPKGLQHGVSAFYRPLVRFHVPFLLVLRLSIAWAAFRVKGLWKQKWKQKTNAIGDKI